MPIVDSSDTGLSVDQLETDERVTEKGSLYYGDVHRFALDTYNYYTCHRCTKPYFGGRRVCDAVPVEGGAAAGRPEDFVCTPCVNSKSTNACQVPAHQDSLVWKCRYCCTPAGTLFALIPNLSPTLFATMVASCFHQNQSLTYW